MQIDSFHNFAPPPYISATDEVTGDQHDSLASLAACLLYLYFLSFHTFVCCWATLSLSLSLSLSLRQALRVWYTDGPLDHCNSRGT